MKKFLLGLVALSLLFSACTPHDVAVAKRISKSTVLVHIRLRKGERTGGALCSGVVVSPNEILLAAHCVNPPEGISIDKIWVRDFNDRVQEATVERKEPQQDLAILKVKKREIPARIGSEVRVGQPVIVVGMPLGVEWCVTKGIVSKTDVKVETVPYAIFFITDATVLPGNSGGGVWNERGELVGIVSMSTSILGGFGAAGLGIIVDTETVRGFLDR